MTGADVVRRLRMMLPNQGEFTLSRRAAGDASLSSTTWNGTTKPADLQMAATAGVIVGQEMQTIELFKEAQTVEPRDGDKIADDAGVVWEIKAIETKVARYVFRCLVLKDFS
jgi:hypothetical protein